MKNCEKNWSGGNKRRPGFMDCIKAGLPLNLIFRVLSVTFIPVFCPA